MPALREMRQDIPLLADAILKRQCAGREPPRLAAAAQAELLRYDFPGNVRELENILERALALATGEEIAASDLKLAAQPLSDEADDMSGLPLQERLDAIERKAIMDALEQTRYNRTAAAKILGITFRALRYRMERLGINDELDAKN
jgi:two-component system response regulator PilR (NtrC family)